MASSTPMDKVEKDICDGYAQTRHIGDVSKAETDYDQAVDIGTSMPDSGPVAFVKGFYDQNKDTIESTATGLAALTSEGRSIESAVSSFSETAKVIIKGLDALAQAHPAIGVAVLAFKLVVTFDMTRRENNKKVLALKIEMQDMMVVLFGLRHIKDPVENGPSGSLLGARMQVLMEKIAHDIKDAGSACDAYMKKSFLARTLKSKIYEGRLAEYGATFESNKLELQRALTLHTARGVDVATEMLGAQNLKLDSMESKINEVLQVFRKLDSPREKDVQKFLEESGGPKTCIESDSLLTKLVEISGETLSAATGIAEQNLDFRDAREVLLKELKEDVNKMFETNFVGFQRKLAMQSHQLDVIQASNEHIVTMLSSGSHEKILDYDLQTIWREMGWKGSVKARHFVLALHDYFSDQSAFPSPPSNGLRVDDRWALAYINIAHVQSIMEAVDDDGTGFVSIREVNSFVSSQPLDWTLLQRLAYWAAGWDISIASYKRKIYLQVQKMFELKDKMSPANRRLADEYLASPPMLWLEATLRSTKPGKIQHHPELAKLVERYDKEEEKRLTENLVAVAYELDSVETVSLITGPGRIERYLFPLVHILLKRDLRIMMLACTHLLHDDEFVGSESTLHSIFGVVDDRVQRIAGSVKHAQADLNGRLECFSLGMFQLWYQHDMPAVKAENSYLEWWDYPGASAIASEDLQGPDPIPITELKLGPLDLTVLTKDYMTSSPDIADIPGDLTLLGHWSGHFWTTNVMGTLQSALGLIEFRIDSLSEGEITGVGQLWKGSTTVSGTLGKNNEIKLSIQYTPWSGLVCEGKFNPDRQTIEGLWSGQSEYLAPDPSQTAFFSRTPAHLERFRYTPTDFHESPARARWAFARQAILHEVQRKSWSWTYLKFRLGEMKSMIKLARWERLVMRGITPNIRPNQQELDEIDNLRTFLPVCVSRICTILVEFDLNRLMIRHMGSWCDSCNRILFETRLICLACVDKDFTNTLDVCRECMALSCSRDKFKHEPSHSMIKFEYVIHNFSEVWSSRSITERAKAALKANEEAAHTLASESAPPEPKPSIFCVNCSKAVTIPCWVCQACRVDTFICLDCEEKRVALPEECDSDHQLYHPLIRIGTTDPDPKILDNDLSLEARLTELVEQRTDELEKRITQLDTKVEERLTRLETKMEERFFLFENLLSRIVAKVEATT